MPEISRFFGVVIRMYAAEKEHNPPHFHAIYNEYESLFSIDPLEQMKGNLPPLTSSYIWSCYGMGTYTSKGAYG